MFKKKLPIIFVGLSVVVVMLVLGWVVFVRTDDLVQVPVVSDDVVSDEAGDDDIPDDIDDNNNNSEIDTSNWKTYQNERYGYEIKYPKDWILETYEEDYGKNAKKSIRLAFHTKDKQKIEGYQESLMASVNIAIINKESSDFTVEDYLKDFGYDFNQETIKDGRILRTRGIAETWMRIKKENFKGNEAYIIQTLEDFGYYLYFEYNQNIYKITSLYRKKEKSKQEILEIINTFKFTK